MTIKRNSFEGVAAGTNITVANSASGGDVFDNVVGTLTAQTNAAMVGNMGVVANLTAATDAYAAWNVSGTTHWSSRYFRIPAAGATHNMRMIRGMTGATIAWEVRYNTATPNQLDLMVGGVQRLFLGSFTYVVGTNYRVEVAVTAANATISVYEGNATTPLETKTYTGAVAAIDQIRYGLMNTTAVTSSMEMDGVGWSDTESLGPYPVAATVSAGVDQSVEPWSTVTLSATSSTGSVTWSQVSGTSVTLSGTGLVRTFSAPPSLSAASLTFRATVGAVTDDVIVSILPATDAIRTAAGLVPIRLTNPSA